MYLRVQEIFALAGDYDPGKKETAGFFQTIQNKLHFAATGQTAPELIASRADHTKSNMGLTSWKGDAVRKADVTVAKNDLNEDEIRALNRIVTRRTSWPSGSRCFGRRGRWSQLGLPHASQGGDNSLGLGTGMTKALEDVFREAEKLPEAQQEQLAAAIRAELEAELIWEDRLAASPKALEALADEALAEHRSGRSHPLDPDSL